MQPKWVDEKKDSETDRRSPPEDLDGVKIQLEREALGPFLMSNLCWEYVWEYV